MWWSGVAPIGMPWAGVVRLFCIVVTYKRERGLENTFRFVEAQRRQPDRIILVDNAGGGLETSAAVRTSVVPIEVVNSPENLGPAGGTALAMERILEDADTSWASDVAEKTDIGIIAGNVPVGFGRFVAGFDEPNDGTVAVSETRMPGARDHLVMPVSHVGMLISQNVIDQTAAFLKRGEFLRET